MSKFNKLKNFCTKLQETSKMFATKHSVIAGFEMKNPNTKLANHAAYKYLESCPQQLYTYLHATSKQFLLNTFKKTALKKMCTSHLPSEFNSNVNSASIITTPNQTDKLKVTSPKHPEDFIDANLERNEDFDNQIPTNVFASILNETNSTTSPSTIATSEDKPHDPENTTMEKDITTDPENTAMAKDITTDPMASPLSSPPGNKQVQDCTKENGKDIENTSISTLKTKNAQTISLQQHQSPTKYFGKLSLLEENIVTATLNELEKLFLKLLLSYKMHITKTSKKKELFLSLQALPRKKLQSRQPRKLQRRFLMRV